VVYRPTTTAADSTVVLDAAVVAHRVHGGGALLAAVVCYRGVGGVLDHVVPGAVPDVVRSLMGNAAVVVVMNAPTAVPTYCHLNSPYSLR
jgi:hypothetical protein